jgi:hypothetical protein
MRVHSIFNLQQVTAIQYIQKHVPIFNQFKSVYFIFFLCNSYNTQKRVSLRLKEGEIA